MISPSIVTQDSEELREWELLQKNQKDLYPRGQSVAPPFILMPPKITSSFLQSEEGRLVSRIVEWFVTKQSAPEKTVPGYHRRMDAHLAWGTCRGQSIVFSHSRRLKNHSPSLSTTQEKTLSVFFQVRFLVQDDISDYRSKVIQQKKEAEDSVQKYTTELAQADQSLLSIQAQQRQEEVVYAKYSHDFSLQKQNRYFTKFKSFENKLSSISSKIIELKKKHAELRSDKKRLSSMISLSQKKITELSVECRDADRMRALLVTHARKRWKEIGLGLGTKRVLVQGNTFTDMQFISYVLRNLRQLCNQSQIESILIHLKYQEKNKVSHVILFQPTAAAGRLFDIQTGVVNYQKTEDFLADFRGYLTHQKCRYVYLFAICPQSVANTIQPL